MGRRLVPLAVLIALVTWLPSMISGQGENAAAGPGSPAIKSLSPEEAGNRVGADTPNTSLASSLSDAERLYRAGKFAAAAQEFNSLITSGSQPAIAYAGLTRVYLKEKKPAEAYAAAAKAIELQPTLPDAHIAVGEAYFRQGRIAEAENEFVTLVRAGTPRARAYWGMARVSQANSFYRQAKRMIDKAHDLDPADPDIQRFWLSTVSLQDQIKSLQDYLSRETNDDAKNRRDLERELVILENEAAQPTRPCQLATKVSSTQTNLRRLLIDANRIRGYGLNVQVNGTAATLLVDTGASGVLVDRKVAEKAGIKQVVQSSVRGIGDQGEPASFVGHADSIRIGDLEFKDCYVEVIERNSVAGDDGLIGADVFSHFLVDLDFPNGKLRLSELPSFPGEPAPTAALESRTETKPQFHDRYVAPEMRSYWPVFRFGHELVISTRLNSSTPKLFLIDSGSLNNTISPEAAREVTKLSADSNARVKGLNGKVNDVFRANELILSFANFREINRDMIAFDTNRMSDDTGTEISGILGFAMLWMLEIKIDYRDGLVNFEYDPNRWR